MAELKNCSRCGKIFAMTIRDVCPACHKQEEDDFQTVYRFLTKKKNREATILEIVDATGVEEEVIIKFIKQHRLRAAQFPNLSYSCENCGEPITEGRLCGNCVSSIKSQIELHERQEKEKEEKSKEESIYFTMKKKNR